MTNNYWNLRYEFPLNHFKRFFLMGIISLFLTNVMAQERTIYGKVVDENNEGLPGVNIVIKGTALGTITAVDGTYRLNVPEEASLLVFSTIGYNSQEVTVGVRSVIDVAMEENVEELKEVIVIGYGTVEKGDVTGVVTQVSADKFNKGVIVSPDQLLSGKVAGVNISNSGGTPGGGFNINIRGATSLNASSQPLIVLDGVPLDVSGMPGGRNALNFLNPSEIASMTVLKDASAAAIYGSRGSNGVIIITTKTGKSSDKTTITYDASYGVSQFDQEIPVLTGDQFTSIVGVLAPGQSDYLGGENTVWLDEILRSSTNTTHNIAISGAIEDGGYRVSLGYQEVQGVIQGSQTERTDVNFNMNKSILNDAIKFRISSKNGFTQNLFASNQVGNALFFNPTQPIYSGNSDYGGYFEWTDTNGVGLPLTASNPVAENRERQSIGGVNRSLNNIEITWQIPYIEGLEFTANTAYDIRNSTQNDYTPTYLKSETLGSFPGYYRAEAGKRTSLIFEGYGAYKKDLGDLDFSVLAGYSYQENQEQFISFNVDSLQNNLYGLARPSIGTYSVLNADNFEQENRLISFYGRANVSYKDKYVFTGTLRRDGSTRFGPQNRWGVFPSFAGSWRISNETFMEGISGVLSYLKLRVGWGVAGNQDFGNYLWLETYQQGAFDAAYQLGNEYYLTVRPVGVDPNIKWEETATTNIGFDYELFTGKIVGSFEFYQKTTTDLLFNSVFPAGSLTRDRAVTNIGEMSNKGFELELGTHILKTANWDVSFNMNAAYNQNEMVNLDAQSIPQGDEPPIFNVGGISGDIGQTIQVLQVGQSINSFYTYEHIIEGGVPNFSPLSPTNMYVDQNGDGLINENDLTVNQSPAPNWILGFTGNSRYKNFDLNFTFRAMMGNYVYNNVASNNGSFQSLEGIRPSNIHSSALITKFTSRQLLSDYYLDDASFLRLDNLSIGYTFNQLNWVKVRTYVSGQNLWLKTGYTGLDPEIQPNGIDNNLYPRPTTFIGGISVTF